MSDITTEVTDADETVTGFYADGGLLLVDRYAELLGDTPWEITVGVSREEDETPVTYLAVASASDAEADPDAVQAEVSTAVEAITAALGITDRRVGRDRHRTNRGRGQGQDG